MLNAAICPVCEVTIEGDDVALQQHVNSHFPTSDRTKESLVKCEYSNCGANVSHEDMQSHLDGHLAEQIDMEERQSFEQLKRKNVESAADTYIPTAKRQNSGSSNKRYNLNGDLEFLDDHDITTLLKDEKFEESRINGGDAQTNSHHADVDGCNDDRDGEYYDIGVGEMVILRNASDLKLSIRTPGLILILRSLFTSLHEKSNTSSAYLADPSTDHISSDLSDTGWGCGYRNLQMMMSYLTEKDAYVIGELGRKVPDILGLQKALEEAWAAGFDPVGASQLNNSVVKRRKWVGTTEIYTILTYLGIRCTIIDVATTTGPNNTHPRLFEFVNSYFKSVQKTSESPNAFTKLTSTPIHITDRPPIYLQHQGHSRTIVGIEKVKDSTENLLMFDPAKRVTKAVKGYDLSQKERSFFGFPVGTPTQLARPYRVTQRQVSRHKQYQMVLLGDVHIEGIGKENGVFVVIVQNLGKKLSVSERKDRMIIKSLNITN